MCLNEAFQVFTEHLHFRHKSDPLIQISLHWEQEEERAYIPRSLILQANSSRGSNCTAVGQASGVSWQLYRRQKRRKGHTDWSFLLSGAKTMYPHSLSFTEPLHWKITGSKGDRKNQSAFKDGSHESSSKLKAEHLSCPLEGHCSIKSCPMLADGHIPNLKLTVHV